MENHYFRGNIMPFILQGATHFKFLEQHYLYHLLQIVFASFPVFV
jgi:hypothetical protein